MKVAIVCDWLTNVGGAEKVLLRVHQLFPEAPIYTSKYSPKGISWFSDADVRTGWLQVFPTSLRRILGPLRQKWFSHLDLSEYDLVISVTGAEAKAVKCENPATGKRARHICYCHAPTQYYWQLYDDYVKNPGFGVFNPIVRFFFKLFVKPLKRADFEAAQKVEQFVTISNYTKELIQKYYKCNAIVIHPPVDVAGFGDKGTGAACPSGTLRAALAKSSCPSAHVAPVPLSPYYVTTARQVNWKRLDLAVKACVRLHRKLIVIGEGPEHDKLVKMAGNSEFVKFLPLMDREELAKYLAGAKGYIFPSLEPFGIAPVEALAAGCPVIAFHEGGALDYIIDGKNGVFFEKQTVGSLCDAIERFEKMKFNRAEVSRSAAKFEVSRFDKEILEITNEKNS